MLKSMSQPKLYRDIVDGLLAEHEASTPPDASSGYPIRQLGCVWGIYCQIHRFARAALMMSDNGLSHESNAILRIMLEHVVVMHWIIERGDEGVDALLANQSKRMKSWVERTKNTPLVVPADIVGELADSSEGIDEGKALKQFESICKQVGTEELYVVYGFLCNFVHPTSMTSNVYCDATGKLQLVPLLDPSSGNVTLIAHCLIWAERDFDRLTPGQPRADDLDRVANSINAVPMLPPYHPLPPAGPRRRSRKRHGKR